MSPKPPDTDRFNVMKPKTLLAIFILAFGMFFVLPGCDRVFRRDGVGEFLELKFGVPLALKIKEGPREPPIFHAGLREFYEVEFPNMEFDFIGVAVTKNTDENKKEGISFKRENIIWGAMFNNKNACDEKTFIKTKNYISKNWKINTVSEFHNKPEDSFYVQNAYYSPGVIWNLSCGKGLGLSVVVYDYSVLKNEGDAGTTNVLEKHISELLEVMKRRM